MFLFKKLPIPIMHSEPFKTISHNPEHVTIYCRGNIPLTYEFRRWIMFKK